MQVAARGHGGRSSVAAMAKAEAKSCVNEFVAKIVANAVHTISKSEQAAARGYPIYLPIERSRSIYHKSTALTIFCPFVDPIFPHLYSDTLFTALLAALRRS